MLLIHGYEGSLEFYRPLIENLSDMPCRFIPVTLDMNELYIESATNTSFTVGDYFSRELMALLNFLGIKKLGIIAFSSFGGYIAHSLFRRIKSKNLLFYIIMAPAPFFIDSPIRQIFWNMVSNDIKISLFEKDHTFLESTVDKISKNIYSLLRNNPSFQWISQDEINNSLMSMIQEIKLMRDAYWYRRKLNLNVPIQIICGELDEVVPFELSHQVSLIFNNANFRVIPFAGHYFPYDFPNDTANCIREFVADVLDLP
ncbi:MAG: alpha/beta fold hydrolase [Promethearchaeota archaeon]